MSGKFHDRPIERTRVFYGINALVLLYVVLYLEHESSAQEPIGDIERLAQHRQEPAKFIGNGIGIRVIEEGVYEGEFNGDEPDGKGILLFANDVLYNGSFVRGKRTGYGSMTWPNGDVYEGLFFENDISGIGELYKRETGERYRGFFLNGQMQGSGEYEWLDGRRYVGSFYNNALEGRGDLYLPNGTVYRGHFSGDQRHGEGVLFGSDGTVEFQRWNRGSLIERTRVQLTDNCRLEIDGRLWMFRGVNCINGFAHGNGMAVRSDGFAYITNADVVLGRLVSGVVTELSPFELP